jgi:hypothetical protein
MLGGILLGRGAMRWNDKEAGDERETAEHRSGLHLEDERRLAGAR